MSKIQQPSSRENLASLTRLRTAVRAIVVLGILASVAANALSAGPILVGQILAGLAPVALFACLEMLVRVPVTSRWGSGLRIVATVCIAVMAAALSYGHLVALAMSVNQSWLSAHLTPLIIDGTMLVASISLTDLTKKISGFQPLAEAVVTASVPVVDRAVTLAPAPAAQWVSVPEGRKPLPIVPAVRAAQDAVMGVTVRAVKGVSEATAGKVKALRDKEPSLGTKGIAARLKLSESTVRRALASVTESVTGSAVTA